MQYLGFIWAGVSVQDMEAAVSFYRDMLGLRLMRKGESRAHFDAGNGCLLELFPGGQASPDPKTADRQPIVVSLRVDDLESAVAELKLKGVNFIGEIGSYKEQRWVEFSDLEGNRLEMKQMP
jgi:predicted enzyme related to lactoylglutathione lyase